MAIELDTVMARWNRLGATFAVPTASDTPDVEALILDSALVIPGSARLFAMTQAWLQRYEKLVCSHRLAALVELRTADRLIDAKQSATLGYLLASAGTTTRHYRVAQKNCRPLSLAEPLFDAYATPALSRIAQSTSTPAALAWGLWAPPERVYDDALRSTAWIVQHNPSLTLRAAFGGRLAASILVTLHDVPDAGRSESALARTLNVTRVALRDALDQLELCALITRPPDGRKRRIRLTTNRMPFAV